MNDVASSKQGRAHIKTRQSAHAADGVERQHPPFLEWLAQSRGYAIGGAILLGVVGAAADAVNSLAVPTQYTFTQPISFAFEPGASNVYPDNSSFGVTDVIGNDVLRKVYDDLKLGELKIPFSSFSSSVSIRSFSPAYDDALQSFRSALADRRLTAPERTRLEADMTRMLDSLTARSAVVSLSVPSTANISPDLGVTIVSKIPEVWSQLAITEKGVLDLPRRSSSLTLLADSVAQLDPVVATETLQNAANRIEDRLGFLGKQERIRNVRDPQSGKTIDDLQSDFSQLRLSLLTSASQLADAYGVNHSPGAAVGFLTQLSGEFKRMADLARSNSQNIGLSIARITTSRPSNAEIPVQQGESLGNNYDDQAVPQLDSDFMNSIIQLVRQSNPNEFAFRKELIQKQIELDQLATIAQRESSRVDSRLAAIVRLEAASGATTEPTKDELQRSLKSSIDALNSLWGQINGLAERVSADRVSYAAELYRPLPESSPFTSYNSSFNLDKAGTLAAMVFLGLIIGTLIGFGRSALRFYSQPAD